jgi:dihydroorotate dehydrogenase
MGLYPFFRWFLFRLNAERAHALTLSVMRLVGGTPALQRLLRNAFAVPQTPVEAFGLNFPNPVGLAAGYDKEGLAWPGLACLGFGHIEVGTVTPRPQPGNPRPRVFRLPQSRAVINRMGFPSKGADFVARALQQPRPPGLVLGVNLGKNKDTPLEQAAQDYCKLVQRFAPLSDYLAINVSSPNTVGLRRLQGRDALEDLLARITAVRDEQEQRLRRKIPLLVKLAPDLSEEQLDDALEVLLRAGMDGVIATNTTLSREGLDAPAARESGGLSGAPLTQRSLRMVAEIARRTQGRLPIIAAGGVMNAGDARRCLDAGAALVQVYTGLIYTGPGLVKEILSGLK